MLEYTAVSMPDRCPVCDKPTEGYMYRVPCSNGQTAWFCSDCWMKFKQMAKQKGLNPEDIQATLTMTAEKLLQFQKALSKNRESERE